MLMKNKKILILTGSFGNGHISVTNAIVNQFNKMHLPNVTIIEHDLFQEAHPIINSIAKKYYLNSYKYFRKSYEYFYYARPDKTDSCFYKYYGLNRLVNIIIKEKPDLILLTFPTPVVSILKRDFNIDTPVCTVITDYKVHKNWITPDAEKYYVATTKLKQELMTYGVPQSNINVTGIPISDTFDVEVNRDQWLTQHGLDPQKKTLLMVAGAFGVMEGFNEMLQSLVERSDHQFVVVCGKNQALVSQLSEQFKSNNVKVMGYTQEMAKWMSSCDLMLTKPGGITITESMCKHIPLVFFNPAPGQEGENAVYFSHQGYARITHSYAETIHVTLDLLNHPKELNRLTQNMKQDYLPNSAQNICRSIIEILNESMIQSEIQSKARLYVRLFAK
ncbi:diglucosyl diacylglycerol synthase [Macrococcoides caseolyticum]|uniref:diglucosyl diacylglycerol synthase n=1 Tax=Macrococcoides caseolyticum TaxID=69966 RepID=UPI001F2C7546|nr:diglucosyl diacylglycerol synthase [Macrococcus caseolyticus]MCE4955710.1 diglucosyl diacylglycerol synthase [Macrococcus caseolyticus]